MSNTFLTPEDIAKTAAALVGADLGLAALISRDLEAGFTAGKGATVKVRIPGAIAAQTRGIFDKSTPIVLDEIAEQSVDVTLTDNVYNAVALSAGDLDLEIEDFGRQVLAPQTRAIVRDVERRVAAALQATPADETITYAAATPAKAFTAARRVLRANGVSAETPLLAAVGANVYADLLDGPAGTFDADGKVRGITVHENTRLDADEIVVFIRDAFALVVRAPMPPEGAAHAATVRTDGFALTHVRDYDGSVLADRSILQAFVGCQAMPLAVDQEDGTVDLVANGGAVRIDTGESA
jgi:hypothetical protein